MSNIAEVEEGQEWNGQQCSQCGNPVIDGEGIGPEGQFCSDCYLGDDDFQCEICGDFFDEAELMCEEPPICADCCHAGADE